MLLALFSILAMHLCGTLGYDIKDESDMIRFSELVNTGNTFKGITVFLINDLDMEGISFDPIGDFNKYDDHFMGTFDGQGHVIRNLNVSSKKSTVGLFGYCISATVKNIILDSSCRTEATFSTTNIIANVGGVIGLFSSHMQSGVVENIINLGEVVASGETNGTLYAGGIVGSSEALSEAAYIKDCANFGRVLCKASADVVSSGGIAGGYFGNVVPSIFLNLYNEGEVTVTEDCCTFYRFGGGFVGNGELFTVHNCVNKGSVSSGYNFKGHFAGLGVNIKVKNSYYFDELGLNAVLITNDKANVQAYPFDKNFVVYDSKNASSDYANKSLDSLLNAVVDTYVSSSFSRWVLNRNKNVITFRLFQRGGSKRMTQMSFSFDSQIILLPSLADSEIMHFDGWYIDKNFEAPFASPEFLENTTLYGSWSGWDKEYTITFDTNGSYALEPITAPFGTVIHLPWNISRGNEAVGKWVDQYGLTADWNYHVPSYDVHLTATWVKTALSTVDDFIEFTNAVNSGIDFNRLTVFVLNDIDMSGMPFTPIGMGVSTFGGTFDGRGYTIRKIKTKLSYQVSGIFRYSQRGMTIKNVVIGGDCDVTGISSESNEYDIYVGGAFFGGLIGSCTSIDRSCKIENSIVATRMSFHGNVIEEDEFVRLGGIAGSLSSQNYVSRIINCAYIGSLKFSGQTGNLYMGGIVGSCKGSSFSSPCVMMNCLSLGDFEYSSGGNMERRAYIGGIAGALEESTFMTNCAATSNLTFDGPFNRKCIGGITGYASGTTLTNCYWNSLNKSSNGEWDEYGSLAIGEQLNSQVIECSRVNKEFGLVNEVTVGDDYAGYSLISALNAYVVEDHSLARWALNRGGHNISFVTERENGAPETVVTSMGKMLLFPVFTENETDVFYGWFNESTSSPTASLFGVKEFKEDTTLYAVLSALREHYKVTFDPGNGDNPVTVVAKPGDLIESLNSAPKRKGYKFMGWADKYSNTASRMTVPRHDISIHALWLKTTISTPEDLVEFSTYVNTGIDCKGETVYLDNDIDMSGVQNFLPIGNDFYSFLGTFEGQGYRISNLLIENSGEYVGLFGISYGGAEIRNMFLDETFTAVNTHLEAYSYEGGIIGYCYAKERDCRVLNVVNFGNVVSTGISEKNPLTIGGIVGACKETGAECVVFNCANYGNVTHSGSTGDSRIGGIIGQCTGNSFTETCKIWCNLNYATVIHVGVTNSETLEMGGIIGSCGMYTSVSGCINVGNISTSQRANTVSAISGKTDTTSSASRNIWYEGSNKGDFTGLNVGIQEDLSVEDGTLLEDIFEGYSGKLELGKSNVNEYKAVWLINRGYKKVTLHINGRRVVSYKSRVILVPRLFNNAEYSFTGWCRDARGEDCAELPVISDVYADTTLYGFWKKQEDDIKRWVMHWICTGVLCTALLTLASFYAEGYVKRKRKMDYIRSQLYPTTFDGEEPVGSINSFKDLYPAQYARPTMMEALYMAGLNNAEVEGIVKECYEKASKLYENGSIPNRVTIDDVAAIAMYTFDFGVNKSDRSPYHLVNAALALNDPDEVKNVKGILYLVMTALRKLPVVHGKVLHRGIRSEVFAGRGLGGNDYYNYGNDSEDEDDEDDGNTELRMIHKRTKSSTNMLENLNSSIKGKRTSFYFQGYSEGSIITWNSLSSTSHSMNVTKMFLAKGSRASKSTGTLFIIENGWGYDIQQFSLYPTESEILLEPERQFEVLGIIQSESFTVVKLKMLKTPLVLPDVFGRHPLKVPPLYFAEEKYVSWKENRRRKARLRAQNEETRGGNEPSLKNAGDNNNDDNSSYDKISFEGPKPPTKTEKDIKREEKDKEKKEEEKERKEKEHKHKKHTKEEQKKKDKKEGKRPDEKKKIKKHVTTNLVSSNSNVSSVNNTNEVSDEKEEKKKKTRKNESFIEMEKIS